MILTMSQLSPQGLVEQLQWRYATKKFDTDSTLSKEVLKTLKEAFSLTASSYGLQPIKMIVIQDKKLREQLIPHAYGQRQVADSSHLLVICIQKNYGIKDVENYFELVKKVRNTPEKILIPYKENLMNTFSKLTKEDINQNSKSQAYLALGNLLTVCASLQIDSCPMEGFKPNKFDEILKLDKQNLQSVLLLPIGKRANDDQMAALKKVRKPLKESVIEIDSNNL